jgi:hypothetical protein
MSGTDIVGLGDFSVISRGGGREIDVANGEGVSLATGPEDDDNGTSGTTPRPASV